jgi:hypothetical protein
VESLDDVIDAMIAERVIHRHRRKWLIALAVVLVAIVVVLFTGGWKEKQGRTVPTLSAVSAPATVTAGRWEFTFSKAQIIRTPKDEYSAAKAVLRVSFEAKNIDSEEQATNSIEGGLLRLVPGGGQDNIESNGGTCRGQINWRIVYGLPPESCTTEFEIPADFAADQIEVGVIGERYESDNGVLGASEDPYWHNDEPIAVVQLKPTVVIDNGEDK